MTDKELIEVLLDRSHAANDECRTDDADVFDSAATRLQELTEEPNKYVATVSCQCKPYKRYICPNHRATLKETSQ